MDKQQYEYLKSDLDMLKTIKKSVEGYPTNIDNNGFVVDQNTFNEAVIEFIENLINVL